MSESYQAFNDAVRKFIKYKFEINTPPEVTGKRYGHGITGIISRYTRFANGIKQHATTIDEGQIQSARVEAIDFAHSHAETNSGGVVHDIDRYVTSAFDIAGAARGQADPGEQERQHMLRVEAARLSIATTHYLDMPKVWC